MSGRSLTEISDEMRELADKTTGDAETLHPRADALLIETIRRMTSGYDRRVEELAERIISDWKRAS